MRWPPPPTPAATRSSPSPATARSSPLRRHGHGWGSIRRLARADGATQWQLAAAVDERGQVRVVWRRHQLRRDGVAGRTALESAALLVGRSTFTAAQTLVPDGASATFTIARTPAGWAVATTETTGAGPRPAVHRTHGGSAFAAVDYAAPAQSGLRDTTVAFSPVGGITLAWVQPLAGQDSDGVARAASLDPGVAAPRSARCAGRLPARGRPRGPARRRRPHRPACRGLDRAPGTARLAPHEPDPQPRARRRARPVTDVTPDPGQPPLPPDRPPRGPSVHAASADPAPFRCERAALPTAGGTPRRPPAWPVGDDDLRSSSSPDRPSIAVSNSDGAQRVLAIAGLVAFVAVYWRTMVGGWVIEDRVDDQDRGAAVRILLLAALTAGLVTLAGEADWSGLWCFVAAATGLRIERRVAIPLLFVLAAAAALSAGLAADADAGGAALSLFIVTLGVGLLPPASAACGSSTASWAPPATSSPALRWPTSGCASPATCTTCSATACASIALKSELACG